MGQSRPVSRLATGNGDQQPTTLIVPCAMSLLDQNFVCCWTNSKWSWVRQTNKWWQRQRQSSLNSSARSGTGHRVPRAEGHLGTVIVLDAEAVSVLASPKERGSAARRAQAVLEAIERRGGFAVVPAPVLAETSRTRARRDAVNRVLGKVEIAPTDRRIAEIAGVLLEGAAFDSASAIDAFVVATATVRQSALVLTGDPSDCNMLALSAPNVAVQSL